MDHSMEFRFRSRRPNDAEMNDIIRNIEATDMTIQVKVPADVLRCETLSEGMWKLYKTGRLVDTNLRCHGVTRTIHGVVAAVSSPVLQLPLLAAAGANGRKEASSTTPTIVLDGLDFTDDADLDILIEFMYRAEAAVPLSRVRSLLRAAEILQITSLVRAIGIAMDRRSEDGSIKPEITVKQEPMSEDDGEVHVDLVTGAAESNIARRRCSSRLAARKTNTARGAIVGAVLNGKVKGEVQTTLENDEVVDFEVKHTDKPMPSMMTTTTFDDAKEEDLEDSLPEITIEHSPVTDEVEDTFWTSRVIEHDFDDKDDHMDGQKEDHFSEDIDISDTQHSDSWMSSRAGRRHRRRREMLNGHLSVRSHSTTTVAKILDDICEVRMTVGNHPASSDWVTETNAWKTSSPKKRRRAESESLSLEGLEESSDPASEWEEEEKEDTKASTKRATVSDDHHRCRRRKRPINAPIVNGKKKYPRARLQCEQCDYSTTSKTSYDNHQVKHDPSLDVQRFKCGTCPKAFRSRMGYQAHQKTHGDPNEQFHCNHCTFSTPHKSSWRQHMAVMHKVDAKSGLELATGFRCDQCDFECVALHQLKQHTARKHTLDKPFKCAECKYEAVERGQLVKHVKFRHRNERPFMCNECGFRSQTPSALRRHQDTHRGIKIKPFKCAECGMLYTDNSSYKRHLRRHANDEIPFVCHVCGHSFRGRDYIRKHLREAHDLNLDEGNLVVQYGGKNGQMPKLLTTAAAAAVVVEIDGEQTSKLEENVQEMRGLSPFNK